MLLYQLEYFIFRFYNEYLADYSDQNMIDFYTQIRLKTYLDFFFRCCSFWDPKLVFSLNLEQPYDYGIYIHHTEVLSVLAQGLFISKSIPMWDHVKIVFFFFFLKFSQGSIKNLLRNFPLYTFVMFRQHVVHVISVCIYKTFNCLICSPITSIQFLLCFVRKKLI